MERSRSICGLNGGDQKLLNAFFPDYLAETTNVRRIIGHARFIIGHLTAEELPENRIHPTRTEGLMTLIEGMLQ